MRGASSIDVIADAVGDEGLDFAGLSSPDGAVTLLFGELGGSTDSGATLQRIVDAHEGTVVKSQEDGFMCSFTSAHAGVRSAIDMQRALPRPRLGLHSGFVIADASDFFGRNVVLAARIADSARGGEILVSSTVRDYTSSDSSLRFESRGDFHFKGLLGEHAVYAVAWEAA